MRKIVIILVALIVGGLLIGSFYNVAAGDSSSFHQCIQQKYEEGNLSDLEVSVEVPVEDVFVERDGKMVLDWSHALTNIAPKICDG